MIYAEAIGDQCSLYMDEIEQEALENNGLRAWDNNDFENDYIKTPPKDITSLTSEQLGQYYWTLTQYEAYTNTLLTRAELEYECAKDQYYYAYREGMHEYSSASANSSRKMTAEERSIEINGSPGIREYFQYKKKCQSKINTLKRHQDSIKIFREVCSREISRRESEFKNCKRNV